MLDWFLQVIDTIQMGMWDYIWNVCQCPTDGMLAWYHSINDMLQSIECPIAPWECQ